MLDKRTIAGGWFLLGMVTVSLAKDPPAPAEGAIRVATYNVAMYRDRAGLLTEELRTGRSRQAERIAEVIQRVRPDLLLLCEIDYAAEKGPIKPLIASYLALPQAEGLRGIDYPSSFTAPVNTGDPSGLDLDFDGRTDGPNDAWGFGRYPGQYGMAVLSRYPIDHEATRSFRELLWSALPDARQPIDPKTGQPYYPDGLWRKLRLSSKSFWDVVVTTPYGRISLLCSHPTPPVFDGPEDRNGCRNADEIALVDHYVNRPTAEFLVDDQGLLGGLDASREFVILGDLNADPVDGDDRHGAIDALLTSERVARFEAPRSQGAVAAAERGIALNAQQKGDPSVDTADFGGDGVANMRVDYALPSRGLEVKATGVYWPKPGEPGAEAITASDHRMVWVDLVIKHDDPPSPQ
ncbi:Endonuclease/Exonuclease/phosphatase family protein [Planctomycetes bacterium MalM25]|nr:Endonuclease/Exonuclease/phosphatase family protein [Planctomycetes bacterium MalM25]